MSRSTNIFLFVALLLVGFVGRAMAENFPPLPGAPGQPVAQAGGGIGDELGDEFEDLLSDNPKPRKKKKKVEKKQANPFEPNEEKIKTWTVSESKLRDLSSEKKGNPTIVKQKASGLLGERLPNEVNKTPLNVGPVEWDLEQDEESAPNEAPVASEVAVILANNAFYPTTVHLAPNKQARIYFTTTNKKPAALIIERLNIQRWIAKDGAPIKQNDVERAPWEITEELGTSRLTEITIVPKKGSYSFYDALSGARGEIVVE